MRLTYKRTLTFKAFSLLTFIFAVANNSSAQNINPAIEIQAPDTLTRRNSILVSPTALIILGNYRKIRVRVQHATKYYFVFGTDLKYYFQKAYPGFQVSPFIKYFPIKINSNGFYCYVNGVYGKNKGLPDNLKNYYNCYGGGTGLGWQFVFGHNKCGTIDLAGGLRYVDTEANLSINYVPEGFLDYYTIGPASTFDGIIAIGFRL